MRAHTISEWVKTAGRRADVGETSVWGASGDNVRSHPAATSQVGPSQVKWRRAQHDAAHKAADVREVVDAGAASCADEEIE
jgi:hypothetical protein